MDRVLIRLEMLRAWRNNLGYNPHDPIYPTGKYHEPSFYDVSSGDTGSQRDDISRITKYASRKPKKK